MFPIVEKIFFHCDGVHRDLHSFPTRRSSDLASSAAGSNHPVRRSRHPGVGAQVGIRRDLGGAEVEVTQISSEDRKSTRLNSSHITISYAVLCLKKKKRQKHPAGLTNWHLECS